MRNYPRFGYRFDSPDAADYPPWVRINFLQTQCLWLWQHTDAAEAQTKAIGVEWPVPPWAGAETWDPTGLHEVDGNPASEFPPHLWEVREREIEPAVRELEARRQDIVDGKYGKLDVEPDEETTM